MTLPLHTALAREHDGSRRSADAAEAHDRLRGRFPFARMDWTPRNVAVLTTLVLMALAAVAGVIVWGISVGRSVARVLPTFSVDTSTPRGALGAYFAALQRGDEQEAIDLLCEDGRQSLLDSGFVEATAAPLEREPIDPPVVLGQAKPLYGGQYYVDATNGESNTGLFRIVPEAGGEYRVCGFW